MRPRRVSICEEEGTQGTVLQRKVMDYVRSGQDMAVSKLRIRASEESSPLAL